jgi:flagellar hook-basal body complex protein FliE
MDRIEPLATVATGAAGAVGAGSAPVARSDGATFGRALKDALQSVSEQQAKADELQRRFQLNDPEVGLEETMIATQTANLSFQALVHVRNRLISAYQEIMNLNI